ncbi:MAG: hypothetical protein N2515_01220, partial [Deltaproteobacteria bacterium]|nr:hypothetical protein [Deltaproteobacteria bacterium]
KSVATSNQQTDGNGKASKKQAATSKTPTLASTSTSKSKNSSETNSTKSKVSKKQIPSDSASELGSKPQLQKTGKSK